MQGFRLGALVAGVAVVAGGFAGMSSAAGAVPAKKSVDPCAVMTDADLSGLATPQTITNSVSELSGNCTYDVEGGGDSTQIQLFVESPIGYQAQKSATSKVKKVSGLPGGYVGKLTGGSSNEAAYKSGKTALRLSSSGDLTPADLIVVLKAIHKHAG
jgi:hypothetical protein